MTVHGKADEVRIDFANPCVRDVGAGSSERVLHGTPDTASCRPWLLVVDCVRTGRAPLSLLRGGLDDLRLADDIVEALPPQSGGPA